VSFKIEDGKVTVTMMYKATQPSEVPYASESATVGVALEFPVKGDSDKILDSAEKLEQELQAHCVFSVASALGLNAELREDGSAALTFKRVAAVQQNSGGGGGGGSKGGGGGGSKPNAPQLDVDFGNGRRKYYDYRAAKASGGYGANRPDFVAVDDDSDALWLMDRSGKEKRYMSVALANSSPSDSETAPF
jgi:hypothetical protein